MKRILLLFFITINIGMYSKDFNITPFFGEIFKVKNGYNGFNIYPVFGSHINGISYDIFTSYDYKFRFCNSKLFNLSIYDRITFSFYESYLGIPGQSVSTEICKTMIIGLENDISFPVRSFLVPYNSEINLFYGVSLFFPSDNTNQYVGAVGIVLQSEIVRLRFQFNNDLLTWLYYEDNFRTAAVEFQMLFAWNNYTIGGGMGFKLWAGSRRGLEKKSRGENYDLSNQYGGKYSNGILYISLFFEGFQLSIGWDSEEIRTIIQNNVHFLINAGNLPALDRSDTIYIQFSINTPERLY